MAVRRQRCFYMGEQGSTNARPAMWPLDSNKGDIGYQRPKVLETQEPELFTSALCHEDLVAGNLPLNNVGRHVAIR